MNAATTQAAGASLVRITVARGRHRADLAVPLGVPVAELLPDLAATVGGLDPAAVHAGYRLVRRDGAPLDPESTLLELGVGDGDTLTLHAGADDPAPKVYDDLVEAVSDIVESGTRPWGPEANRRTALVGCGVLFAVAAIALASQRAQGLPVAVAAGVSALLLMVGSAVLARALREGEAAVVVGWCAAPFAAVAGAAADPGAPLAGAPAAYAGIALVLVVVGVGTALGARVSAILPLGGLAVLLTAAGAATAGGTRPAIAYAVGMVVAVLLGAALPRIAFMVTRLRAPQPHNDDELLADPDPIDRRSVAARVLRGRAVAIGTSAALALTTAVSVPFAVALGLPGTLLAVATVVAVVLGTRRYRDTALVWCAMAGAVTGVGVTGTAVIVVHPEWRSALVISLLVVGVLLLVLAALPRRASVRLGRAVDVVEGIALVVLLPLLVVAVVGWWV